MTTPPSTPPNRRRRRIVVITIAVLMVGLGWWFWPRVDQRFVEKSALTGVPTVPATANKPANIS